MAEPLERRAMGFIDRVRRLVAILRWGPRSLVVALTGFSALATATALSHLPKDWQAAIPKTFRPWISLPFWLGGGLALCLVALSIYRRVTAPLLQTSEMKLPALKGAASFTPEDAELFTQLGRGADLEQLRAWILDDQKPLVVLMGESGVGKTSLLRAGLAHALKADGREPIYWEALPSEPEEELLHAVRSAWGKTKIPADLAELPLAIAESERVVVLDQFEQILPDAHPVIFDLLRSVVSTPPPYRGTWIVAFRREYSATWVDFTLSLPEPIRHRIETFSLSRFTIPAARRVVAVLATAAALPVDQQVVDTLVDGLAVDGRISPVDLGISLLGLGEFVGAEEEGRISLDDFRAKGGPSGLLTRYLERQLSLVSPPADRDELLAALLTLLDLGRNQRRAEGLTIEELITRVRPISPAHFQAALRFFALGKARVLEILADSPREPRYRLLHERFIEPVRVLSGTVLAAAAQAALRLDEAYRSWSLARHRHRLLSGSELRLVLRHQDQLPWGEDEGAKREFLRLSQRRRTGRRFLLAATAWMLLGLGVGIDRWMAHQQIELQLRTWGLPGDLERCLGQLETLEIDDTVTSLDWLANASRLRSLNVHARLSKWAALPPNLEGFTCQDCIGAEYLRFPSRLHGLWLPSTEVTITQLAKFPRSLTDLEFMPPAGTSLSVLPASLKSLKLDDASDTGLSRHFSTRFLASLPAGLEDLDLDLNKVDAKDLSWVPRKLVSLRLIHEEKSTFSGSPSSLRSLDLWSGLGDTVPLETLPAGLTSLTFHEDAWRGLDLSRLSQLSTLDLNDGSVRFMPDGYPPVSLKALTCSAYSLESIHFTDRLEELNLKNGEIDNLKALPSALKSLTLDGVRLKSWAGLPPRLHSLKIYDSDLPQVVLGLPQTLEELVVTEDVFDHTIKLTHLPPHLVYFRTDGSAFRGMSGDQILSLLPSSLRSLDFSEADFYFKDLEHFPRHLEIIKLRMFHVTDLKGMPASVRDLEFSPFKQYKF
jgi:hypothetical protein